jgi:hypothetical protein
MAAPGAVGPTEGDIPVAGDEPNDPDDAAPPVELAAPPEDAPPDEPEDPPDEPPLLCARAGSEKMRIDAVASAVARRGDLVMTVLLPTG